MGAEPNIQARRASSQRNTSRVRQEPQQQQSRRAVPSATLLSPQREEQTGQDKQTSMRVR